MPTFCLGKMSVLAVYAQLMPFTEMVLLVKISATLSVLASVAIVLANLFLCSPPRHFWDSWADAASDGHCNSLIESYFWTGLVNSVSDAFVILLPMPWLYSKCLRLGLMPSDMKQGEDDHLPPPPPNPNSFFPSFTRPEDEYIVRENH